MKREILANLISFNTINDLENEKIREYIKDLLIPLNFQFECLGKEKRKVLIAKRGDADLGFICHTDTVDTSSSWTKDPFTLTEENGKYYGLGVCDMKGGTAAILSAILELPISIPICCYFTYDEEIDFLGIKELIKEKDDLPKNLIFPEPTDNEIMIANKGCLEYKITFTGVSAHASTPNLGENAIYKAITFIDELKTFAEKLKSEQESIYEIPYTTFNLSKIKGGEEINRVPDCCEISFTFRTVNKKQEEEINNYLENKSLEYNYKLDIINNVSCAYTTDSKFINDIERIINKKVKGINFVTEASFFKDKNILIIGPGPFTAHQSDESINIKSYEETIDIFKNIIMNLKK